ASSRPRSWPAVGTSRRKTAAATATSSSGRRNLARLTVRVPRLAHRTKASRPALSRYWVVLIGCLQGCRSRRHRTLGARRPRAIDVGVELWPGPFSTRGWRRRAVIHLRVDVTAAACLLRFRSDRRSGRRRVLATAAGTLSAAHH